MKNAKPKRFRQSPAHRSQKRLLGETGAYLLGSLYRPFRNKWGIGDEIEKRRAQIDADVSGPVYTVFGRHIMFGWACEQFVHWFYQLQHAPLKKSTGRLEWYYTINPIFGTGFLWACAENGLCLDWGWFLLAFVSPFVWIDGLMWLVLFRFLNWGFAVGMFFLIDKILGLGLCETFVSLFRY